MIQIPPARAQHAPGREKRGTPLGGEQRALAVLEALVSASGLGGGAYLIAHPVSAMPVRPLGGTWFTTWRWPGAALFVLVGVAPGLVALATLRRSRFADLGHVCVGAGLVAWVALEAAWIVVAPVLQLAFGAIGVAVLCLGMRRLAARRMGSRHA